MIYWFVLRFLTTAAEQKKISTIQEDNRKNVECPWQSKYLTLPGSLIKQWNYSYSQFCLCVVRYQIHQRLQAQ